MNKMNNNRYYFKDGGTRYYVEISMVSYFNIILLVGILAVGEIYLFVFAF